MRCFAEISALIKAASTMRMWLTEPHLSSRPYSFAYSKG